MHAHAYVCASLSGHPHRPQSARRWNVVCIIYNGQHAQYAHHLLFIGLCVKEAECNDVKIAHNWTVFILYFDHRSVNCKFLILFRMRPHRISVRYEKRFQKILRILEFCNCNNGVEAKHLWENSSSHLISPFRICSSPPPRSPCITSLSSIRISWTWKKK